MKSLIAPTEDFIKLERSRLAADVSAGTNVNLTLENNDGLSDNDFIVVGYEGSELAEMCKINTSVTAGQVVRVATLKFNHKNGEPITKYKFDKRRFWGATSADGSFVELTGDGSPKDIQVDDPMGTLLEYSGTTYTYFKSTYYNSVGLLESDIDDAVAVLGNQSLRYATLWAIRKMAGLAGNPLYSEYRMEMKRKQAENEIDSAIYLRYVLPLTEVPALISYICELLAAGYIDYEEFGKEGEGVKWLGEARSLLKGIQEGSRRLIGADGIELTGNASVDAINGYPDGTIAAGSSEDRKFTLGQKF